MAQSGTPSSGTKVWNLRLFVQTRANSVSNELANHAEAVSFDVFLHRGADITNRVTDACLINPAVERGFGHGEQLAQLRSNILSHGHGNGSVAIIAVENYATID